MKRNGIVSQLGLRKWNHYSRNWEGKTLGVWSHLPRFGKVTGVGIPIEQHALVSASLATASNPLAGRVMQFCCKTTQLLLLLPPTSHNSYSSKHAILQRLSSRKNEHAMVTNGFRIWNQNKRVWTNGKERWVSILPLSCCTKIDDSEHGLLHARTCFLQRIRTLWPWWGWLRPKWREGKCCDFLVTLVLCFLFLVLINKIFTDGVCFVVCCKRDREEWVGKWSKMAWEKKKGGLLTFCKN